MSDVQRNQPDRPEMPAWLAEQWERRIIPMLAASIVRQVEQEKQRILSALEDGATVDYTIDEARERVVFGVEGLAFCEMSYDVILGMRKDGRTH
jgi:hypothetical protein